VPTLSIIDTSNSYKIADSATQVTVNGIHFGDSPSDISLVFWPGNIRCTNLSSFSNTSLVCSSLPSLALSGLAGQTLTASASLYGGVATGSVAVIVPSPIVIPSTQQLYRAVANQPLTISGFNFEPTATVRLVTDAGSVASQCTISFINATQIVCTTSAFLQAGDIFGFVELYGGSSNRTQVCVVIRSTPF